MTRLNIQPVQLALIVTLSVELVLAPLCDFLTEQWAGSRNRLHLLRHGRGVPRVDRTLFLEARGVFLSLPALLFCSALRKVFLLSLLASELFINGVHEAVYANVTGLAFRRADSFVHIDALGDGTAAAAGSVGPTHLSPTHFLNLRTGNPLDDFASRACADPDGSVRETVFQVGGNYSLTDLLLGTKVPNNPPPRCGRRRLFRLAFETGVVEHVRNDRPCAVAPLVDGESDFRCASNIVEFDCALDTTGMCLRRAMIESDGERTVRFGRTVITRNSAAAAGAFPDSATNNNSSSSPSAQTVYTNIYRVEFETPVNANLLRYLMYVSQQRNLAQALTYITGPPLQPGVDPAGAESTRTTIEAKVGERSVTDVSPGFMYLSGAALALLVAFATVVAVDQVRSSRKQEPFSISGVNDVAAICAIAADGTAVVSAPSAGDGQQEGRKRELEIVLDVARQTSNIQRAMSSYSNSRYSDSSLAP